MDITEKLEAPPAAWCTQLGLRLPFKFPLIAAHRAASPTLSKLDLALKLLPATPDPGSFQNTIENFTAIVKPLGRNPAMPFTIATSTIGRLRQELTLHLPQHKACCRDISKSTLHPTPTQPFNPISKPLHQHNHILRTCTLLKQSTQHDYRMFELTRRSSHLHAQTLHYFTRSKQSIACACNHKLTFLLLHLNKISPPQHLNHHAILRLRPRRRLLQIRPWRKCRQPHRTGHP